MLQICHCVQLNALFCCLWRNVEASCHKHFVVFSGNQHRRLLPAMCHNLRDNGRPPPTAFTTSACCSVNTGSQISAYPTCIRRPRYGSSRQNIFALTQAVRFLPTPPAFDAPVRGVPVRILLCCFNMEKTRMAWLPDGEKILICLFVLTWSTKVTDTRTDRWTDRQTPYDDIGRACIASRGKKLCRARWCTTVIQDHRNWYQSKACMWFPISLPL